MPSGNRDLRSTVDLAFARRREVLTEPIFKGRRPDLYMNLMTNSVHGFCCFSRSLTKSNT
jgi:hypothetical protein